MKQQPPLSKGTVSASASQMSKSALAPRMTMKPGMMPKKNKQIHGPGIGRR